MAYQHKPDHLKKKAGRPRKYQNGFTELKQKPYTPKELNRQQTAEKLRGVPVIQLDYLTGEYVGEYPSFTSCSEDLDVPVTSIVGAFSGYCSHCCIARIPRYELLLIKKSAFEVFMESISV